MVVPGFDSDFFELGEIEWLLGHFTLEMLCKDLSSNPCRQMIARAAKPPVKQSFEALTGPGAD